MCACRQKAGKLICSSRSDSAFLQCAFEVCLLGLQSFSGGRGGDSRNGFVSQCKMGPPRVARNPFSLAVRQHNYMSPMCLLALLQKEVPHAAYGMARGPS